ncbi:hypothetical protein [Spirulina subsalsa]|uniref:hypothetical protein n=1 Tax=Spirulina subsalsa TaxID=54311 RepID=UPI0002F6ED44|nr:hypothetical protein [Spirulina subsalsa]
MSIATSEPPATQPTKGEQRVVFRYISWDAYVQLLEVLPPSRGARLTYDQGVLEITMPLEDHEFFRCLIERFIIVLEVDCSPTFPQVPKEWLYDFLVMAKEDEIGAMRALRERWRACCGEN